MIRYTQGYPYLHHNPGIMGGGGIVNINADICLNFSSGNNFYIGQTIAGRNTRGDRKNPFASLAYQKYDEILAKCKAEGLLFEDPEFEAVNTSISFSGAPQRQYEWKRPR
ncbi:calpain-B-like isoform X9, partial [Biomphalaria glabrata]